MNEITESLKNISTPDLLNSFVDLSDRITLLRNTPFATIRQFEDLQDELALCRLYLQMYFRELQTRTLTAEEQERIAGIC